MAESVFAPVPAAQPASEELLARLSLEEKITLPTGADFWTLHGHAEIGHRPADSPGNGQRQQPLPGLAKVAHLPHQLGDRGPLRHGGRGPRASRRELASGIV
jgi:hypothetical protein